MTAKFISNFIFQPREIWFYRLLGLALISCVAEDVINGVWFIHTGQYFPWRHLSFVPLYSVPFLILEWGLLVLSGALILFERTRQNGLRLAVLFVFISISQRFSNHRSLILIVLVYLVASPRKMPQMGYRLIRYQLLIVYLFSALNKIDANFLSGRSLLALGHNVQGAILPTWLVRGILSPPFATPLSWVVVGLEFVIPILLLQWPIVGLIFLLSLHAGFSLMMPAIWPFTFIMVAMGLLFL